MTFHCPSCGSPIVQDDDDLNTTVEINCDTSRSFLQILLGEYPDAR